jgi:non-ribosomal peptide synthase protein (TIGR01720 family)
MIDTPRRLEASAQAVLLAALARAWSEWTLSDSLRVDIEGHGRDVLGDTLDVSRTVGWFTTVFPIHLSQSQDVRAVQRTLDALPLRGAAHGLARHLAPDESVRAALAAPGRPSVLFNLLGTHDVSLPAESRLRVIDPPRAQTRHPDAVRPYGLELNARIESASLIVTIEYSRLAHAADDIERFASAFRDALEQAAEPASALPGIDPASLDIVASLLAEIDEP